MRKQIILQEETIKPEFIVVIYPKVKQYLYIVNKYNRNNLPALHYFKENFETAQNLLAYRSVVFDYANGTSPLQYNDLGLHIYYIIKYRPIEGKNCVHVYRIIIDFDYFGLTEPPVIIDNLQKESVRTIRLTEVQLHHIIRDTIRRLLISA